MSGEDPDTERFVWTDGACGCDCNRALFLARACGLDVYMLQGACNLGPNRFVIDRIELDGIEIEGVR